MPLAMGVVKSGNTRNVNRMGSTNRMIAHITNRAASKPVSINYLRGLVKNYNRQIDLVDESTGLPVHDLHTKARLTIMRETTFTAIKLFQAAYARNDMSAVEARNFCRLHGVMLSGDATPTLRYGGNAPTRVLESLGQGAFDNMGNYSLVKEKKPHLPGGFNVEDGFGTVMSRKDATVTFTPKDREYHESAKPEFQQYLQRVVRPTNLKDYKKQVQGSANVDGLGEVIPNPPVARDSARLGESPRPGKVKSPVRPVKGIKVVTVVKPDGTEGLAVSGDGHWKSFHSLAGRMADAGKNPQAVALLQHSRNMVVALARQENVSPFDIG